jgi:hypothetical protein
MFIELPENPIGSGNKLLFLQLSDSDAFPRQPLRRPRIREMADDLRLLPVGELPEHPDHLDLRLVQDLPEMIALLLGKGPYPSLRVGSPLRGREEIPLHFDGHLLLVRGQDQFGESY